jgi:hypothetical protein
MEKVRVDRRQRRYELFGGGRRKANQVDHRIGPLGCHLFREGADLVLRVTVSMNDLYVPPGSVV